jgi:hypothetical protein
MTSDEFRRALVAMRQMRCYNFPEGYYVPLAGVEAILHSYLHQDDQIAWHYIPEAKTWRYTPEGGE